VHATAYSDDAQVMHLLARAMESRGMEPMLCAPDGFAWPGSGGRRTGSAMVPALILRFFPAEWLPNLPLGSFWTRYFLDGSVPQTNPGSAILTQSKRWTLCWNELATPLTAWRSLCPPCGPAGSVLAPLRDHLVYKPSLGRVGDGVLMGREPADRRDRDRRQTLQSLRSDRLRSTMGLRSHWIAQERFCPRGLLDDAGRERAVCLGVYVIDGHAAGVYARVATTGWVQHAAQDVAVFAPAACDPVAALESRGSSLTSMVPAPAGRF